MIRPVALCLFIISLFAACGPREVHSAMNTTGDVWPADMAQNFEFEITNEGDYTTHLYLKHNNNYGYRNLYLFTTLTFPDGNTRTDTMQYNIAQADGKWLGEGWGELKTIKLYYPTPITQKGNYTLMIHQGMRESDLEGIEQIGLTIEVSN